MYVYTYMYIYTNGAATPDGAALGSCNELLQRFRASSAPPMCVLLYTSAIHMLIAACSGFLAYEATRRNVRVKLSDCAFTGMETLRTCFLEARPQP